MSSREVTANIQHLLRHPSDAQSFQRDSSLPKMAPPRRKTNFSNVEIEQMLSQVSRRPLTLASSVRVSSSSPPPLLFLPHLPLPYTDHACRDSAIGIRIIFVLVSGPAADCGYAREL